MSPEEFDQVKQEWMKFGKSLKTIPKMRCLYCLKDLTDEDAYFEEEMEGAVCKEHLR